MSNLSVMSFLEQANRSEPSIDFSDLPSYEEYMDGGGLMPIPSPLAPLLPLASSLSASFATSLSPVPPLEDNKVDDEKENSLVAHSETEKQADMMTITYEQQEVSMDDEKASQEGVLQQHNNEGEGGDSEMNYCGFDEAVEIKVVARNDERIILALSDGISQREVIFCPSSALIAHGAGSTGIGMWLLGGLVSLVPPSQIEAMRDRLLMFDGLIKAQYSAIIEHFVSQRRGIEKRVKSKIESRIEGWLEQKGRILLKQSLLGKEGEMPAVVQKTVSEVVDFVWPDVKIELWALYDSVMGHDDDSQWDLVSAALSPIPSTTSTTTTTTTTNTTTTSTPTTTFASVCAFVKNPFLIMSTMFHKFRCFFLFTLSPFNQSFGRKIKNVWWWIFKLIRILPFYSMSSLSFLLTLLLIDRTDEFQLISFILEFKGTQFIGVGMISTLNGALRYISCVNFPSTTTLHNHSQISFTHSCDISGPGSNNSFYLDFVAFVLQIILVWVAFFHLPYTKKRYKADEHTFAAAVREEFEGEDEWQVVDTEEKWALVGKGGSLLRGGGIREEGDEEDDEEEEELLEEENEEEAEGCEQKTERECLEVEPVIIDLLDPLFVSDPSAQTLSVDLSSENSLASSTVTPTASSLDEDAPTVFPAPLSVTVTLVDSAPSPQDEQETTPKHTPPATVHPSSPDSNATQLQERQSHADAEVTQESKQLQSEEDVVTSSEKQPQLTAAVEGTIEGDEETHPSQAASIDSGNEDQSLSTPEASTPRTPRVPASTSTNTEASPPASSDDEQKANKSNTTPVLRKRGKKTRNNSGNSPKKTPLDFPSESMPPLPEDNNSDISEGELRRSHSGSGSDSDNSSDKYVPRLTAASTIWGLAYTSCAVFVSSAVNWTPSDTNRQQLRSFRSYLERLGTQRERGRLLYMLKYDLIVFCLLSTLFLASTLRRVWIFWDVPLADWEWQIRADMYWLKTLYGLLSAPFVVFVLPIFAQVLLHLRPTGYTPDGRCVPQQRRGTPPPPPQS